MEKNLSALSRPRSRIATRVQLTNIIILVFILLISVVAARSMAISISNKSSEKLAYFYSLESVVEFNSYMVRDLALVQKVATSKAVTEWFADEFNETKRRAAYSEMMDYIDLLALAELYFGINDSLDEFSIAQGKLYEDFTPYSKLNRYDPDNLWYYELLESENDYVYNIDIDKYAFRWRIWINHKVISEGKTVGVFCSGLSIDTLLYDVFERYDDVNVQGFVVDKNGVILLDSSLSDDYKIGLNKNIKNSNDDPAFTRFINEYLGGIDGYFSKNDQPIIEHLSGDAFDYVAIAPIENSDWSVVTFFNNRSLFNAMDLLPLMLTLIFALIIYTTANALITRRFVLSPLSNLTKSVSEASEENAAIYGETRDDEIGELALRIKDMWERLNAAKNRLGLALSEAEEANLAKSKFLSSMSHEIRTPMNAILGIAEIQLQNETLDPEVREAVIKIYAAGDMLLGIINDILDLSKIEMGKLELLPENYEVASLISDTAQLNMMRIGSKPIEFELAIDENTPALLSGDELRVKQILNNVLSNAFKYTAAGKVELSIAAEPGRDAQHVVLVTRVADTGQGMTREQVDQLFDEYSRFNQQANRTTEGAGLGMSITRNLVQLMEGEIAVESEPGVGTTFTVRLPQVKVNDGVLGKEMAQNLQQFRTRSRAHMKRVQLTREPMPYGNVLIVDDVETNIYVARGLMAPYGLKMDAAASGPEAIEKIKSGQVYDIIFMDHMMPQMDGIEATQIIRELGYAHPIVALTANAVSGQADVFLGSGLDDFISKPIDIRKLDAVLNKLVRDKQPREVVEAARRQAQEAEAAAAAATAAAAGADSVGGAVGGGAGGAIDGGASGVISGTSGGAATGAVSGAVSGTLGGAAASAEPWSLDPLFAEIFTRDALRTLAVLEELASKDTFSEDEWESYRIHVHGMKGALANIRRPELSAAARELEFAAKEYNMAVVSSKNAAFLAALHQLVRDLAPAPEPGDATPATDEDGACLKEQLQAIRAACEEYDEQKAEKALAELREKSWSPATEELLKTISQHLLHSDFDEITAAIETFTVNS